MMRLLRPDTPDTVGERWDYDAVGCGIMQLELQISKKMAIWDDSFKYVGEVRVGVGGPIKHLKGDFIWNLI